MHGRRPTRVEPFRALYAHAPMPAAVCDADGRFLDHNSACADLLEGTGIDPRTASLHDLAEYLPAHADEVDQWPVDLRAVAEADLPSASLHVDLGGGEQEPESLPRPVQVIVVQAVLAGQELLLAHLRDLAGRRTEQQRLVHLATHDALTGLANRELVQRQLVGALEHAAVVGVPVAVCYLDLDRFKMINDTHGHHAGDALLTELGRRLGAMLRLSDTAGRLGGDEFLIVAPGVPDDAALSELRSRVEATLTCPVEVDGVQLELQPSIGAVLSREGEQASSVIRRADAAMYAIKRARRRLATNRVPTPSQRQLLLEQALVAERT